MRASQEQQAAFHKLAERRHDNEEIVLINDTRGKSVLKQFVEDAITVAIQFEAKRALKAVGKVATLVELRCGRAQGQMEIKGVWFERLQGACPVQQGDFGGS